MIRDRLNFSLRRRVRGRQARRQAAPDRSALHARLAALGAALTEPDATSPEVLERTWARRAERVARVPEEEDAGEQLWLVVVRLGCELYGLGVQYVTDICPVGHVTPAPRVPAWVAGMVNVRGRIMSVVDLLQFLGLSAPADLLPGERRLVIVQTPAMELGVLVDAVLAVEAIPLSRLQEGADTLGGLPPDYVRGVVTYGAAEAPALVAVLDLHAVLGDPRLIVQESIL
jgi:chemotaxis signal transduction protein